MIVNHPCTLLNMDCIVNLVHPRLIERDCAHVYYVGDTKNCVMKVIRRLLLYMNYDALLLRKSLKDEYMGTGKTCSQWL